MNPQQFNFLNPINNTSNLISNNLANSEQLYNQDQSVQNAANSPNVQSAVSQAQKILNTNQTQPAQQVAKKGSGGILGTLAKLLPVAGSIALPAIADVATGGLALPFDAALAGVGGAAGQAGENLATGQKPLAANDLTSGIENAAGYGVGGLLTKGAAKVGQALVKSGEAGGNQALDATAKQALNRANFGDVNKGVQIANNLKDNQALLDSFGKDSTDPAVMNQSAKGGLFLNDLDKLALNSGDNIPTTSLISAKNIVDASPAEQQALSEAGIIDNNGAMPESVTPAQANDFAQSLDNQVRQARTLMENAEANSPADFKSLEQNYNDLNALYKKVQGAASTDSVNKTIADYTVDPLTKQRLVNEFGQEQADYLEQAANNAKTHTDLVKAKRPFAEMGNVSKEALKQQQATATPLETSRVKAGLSNANGLTKAGLNVGGLFEAAKTGNPLMMGPGIVMDIAQSPVARTAIGKMLQGIADTGIRNTNEKIPTLLAQIGANIPNMAVNNSGNSGVVNPLQGTNALQPYDQALQDALQSIEYAQQTPFMPGAASSIGNGVSEIGALIPFLQKVGMAQNALTAATNQYNLAGGGQGGVGGLADTLMSLIPGTQQHAYRTAAQTAGGALSGISGTPMALPSLLSSQPTAQSILNNLGATLLGGIPAPAT